MTTKEEQTTVTTEQMRYAFGPLRWTPNGKGQWFLVVGGRMFIMRGSGDVFSLWDADENGSMRDELAHDVIREEVDEAVLRVLIPDGMVERNPMPIHVLKGEMRMSMKAQIEVLTAERDAWREFALAERQFAGAQSYGKVRASDAAFKRLAAAEATLRALGIDPNATEPKPST